VAAYPVGLAPILHGSLEIVYGHRFPSSPFSVTVFRNGLTSVCRIRSPVTDLASLTNRWRGLTAIVY
jgi:hypothetical protein